MSHDTTDATDLSHLIDAPLSDCDHERFERNHYFHGKLMTARDMAAEQAYHAGQRRAHARSVAGSGVAWGLGASVRNDGDAVTVAVDRGYAIDGCGRAIVVPQDRETTVTDPDVVGADEVTVELVYESCLLESVPISGAESACEDECAYNRVLEAYRIEVSEGRPDEAAKPVPDVTFPAMDDYDRSGREQPASGDPELSTVATSYRNAEEATTGDPTAGSVFVGAFEAPDGDADGGEWSPLSDAHPPSLVYTNDMLYAATARHVADFENPHQVTLTTATPDDGDGAAVRVLDDESDDPDVTVASADGSVDVAAAADQHVDLSVEEHVEDYVEDVLEARLEPLERYTIQQALKYTGLVFARAAARFEGDAAATAEEITRLVRGAIDGRLVAESDAVAAHKREILDEEWDVAEELDGDVFRKLVEQIDDHADEFAEQVEDSVTDASHKRLLVALERLQAAVDAEEAPTDPLPLASTQDDVADAVEWLEPLAGDEPASGSLGDSVVTGHRGDIVELSVDLEGTDSAELSVGSEDVGYLTTLDVQSGTVGGSVTILMNSFLAGRSADTESRVFGTADDADSVTATLEVGGSDQEVNRLLDPGEYDLRLQVEGEPADVGTLSLSERSTDGLSALTAPSDAYADLVSVESIDQAREDGTLVESDEASLNDVIVADVAVNGVFGAIAAESGDPLDISPDGFRELMQREPQHLDFDMVREEPSFMGLSVWHTFDDGALRFVFDQSGGRLIAVLDRDEATWSALSDGSPVSPDGEYELAFEVQENSLLADEQERVVDTITVSGPVIEGTTSVPDVVGMDEEEAEQTLAEAGLSVSTEHLEVQRRAQLQEADYDQVVSQSHDAGSEVATETTIALQVLVSRPMTDMDGIGPRRGEQLALADVRWVHDMVRADIQRLARETDFGPEQLSAWQKQATEFLRALHASLRFEVDFGDAATVAGAFQDLDATQILELDEATAQSQIEEAMHAESIDPTAAQEFLRTASGVEFDETIFEDIDFDPTG